MNAAERQLTEATMQEAATEASDTVARLFADKTGFATIADLKSVTEALIGSILFLQSARGNTRKFIDSLVLRISELEAKAAEKQKSAGVRWSGVYENGKAYAEGQLVTKAGGLWLACHDQLGIPGTPGSGWRLIVKGGGK